MTVAMAKEYGCTAVFVPKTELPYYAQLALHRHNGDPEGEYNWNITNNDVADEDFLELLEKCDYDAWKQGKKIVDDSEDDAGGDTDWVQLTEEEEKEIVEHLNGWYDEMRKKFKMAKVPTVEIARIFLVCMEERAE